MRIKKSILRQMSSSPSKRAIPDLDPTTNLGLHEEIWTRLQTKIATHLLKGWGLQLRSGIVVNLSPGIHRNLLNPLMWIPLQTSSDSESLWIPNPIAHRMNGDLGGMSDGC